ncbi:hypothetical protein BKA67DRAFT_640346 [Truncatella angustata]|uniref:F-box domain-containing protein n=1 Tax=Truncatella angustata TaxID=152316 RepID=A0A9P9A104_9PEZI|nr:uncharacterized protein BKA67DRAFT_640346 [Truncatella angustata]KAH6659011.1 hypothetical protein BKA67DRAFT_640346 [Truncatella angustata]
MAQPSTADKAASDYKQGALRLSFEIVKTICDLVDNKTIKNLRLTCRFYSQTAILRLSRVFISANPQNLEVFSAVASHQTLRNQVTEVIWDDATLFEGLEVPREAKDGHYPEDEISDDSEDEDSDNKNQNGIDWSGTVPSWYRKACEENILDFNQAKGQDTDRPDHAARAVQLSSHMPVTEAWAYYNRLLEQQRGVLKSEEHIHIFGKYIGSFPALRRITITPATYGRLFNPLYETPMIRAFPQGFNSPIPRGWPVPNDSLPECPAWENTGSDWQGFRIVSSVLAQNKDLGRVTDLCINAYQLETGLNLRVFDRESNEAFQHFEKLLARPNFKHLYLDLMVEDHDRQAKIFRNGLLKRALNNAANGKGLEHLHVGTNIDIPESTRRAEFYVTLDTIFGSASLSRLRHFGLSRFYVRESDLLGLLALLPHTIRTIELNLLQFMDSEGSFQSFLTQVRDTLNWADRKPRLRPTLRISVQTGTKEDFRQIWVEDDVTNFLYSGGSNPFGDDPGEPYPNNIKNGFGYIRDAFEPEYERPNVNRTTLRELGYLKPLRFSGT